MTFCRLGGILWAADQRGGELAAPVLGGSVGSALQGGTRRFSYLLALCRSSSALRKSSMVFAFSANAMISSRSALLAYFTSSSPVLGVVTFPPLPSRRLAAVRWAGAVRPGLVPDVSRWPRRRQPHENISPSPPKGGRGELFLHKFSGLFLVKMAKSAT